MGWFHWAINRISSYNWEKIGESAFDTILYVVTVIVVARILYWVLEFILRHALVGRKLGTIIKENKSNTIYSLLRSMLFYIITFTVIIDTMRRIFSFDTSTLLASVSVLGVALGFGSSKPSKRYNRRIFHIIRGSVLCREQ